jgi:TolB-like protein
LGTSLRNQLERAGVIADHRLEGRRIDRVLDDIFALQAQLLGQSPEDRRQRTGT